MALIRRIGFTRFSRWGDNLGRLTVSAATHTDALDGTDELNITCAEDLVKGDRVVWIDLQGTCHEHIVDTIDRVHDDSGAPETQAVCINSVNETWDDWLDDKRPSGGVSVALASVLADTRWEVGTCDQGGSASRTFYHESVREGLAGIIETWGGELETLIVHNGAGIVSRRVGVRAKRGNQSSAKRFTWTKDLLNIKRTVLSENPKTRVYGYGKGVETESGGYGRRLTFGDVNGGIDYVEDEEATAIWGHPDADGGIAPAVGSYVNEQCEDACQLLEETRAYLESVKQPKVSYTASVIDLCAFGREWEGVGLGDDVAVIDKGFGGDGIRLRARVSQIARNLLTGDASVTFGNLSDAMADMWQSVSQTLQGNSAQNALYDAVAGASAGWLAQLQAALNAQFDAAGTYMVETFELGTVWSNVPLDGDTGLPVKSTSAMWAININGRGFRIASGLASGGGWDWRTFGTGEGFTADVITAGTVKGGSVNWNLETGLLENVYVLSETDSEQKIVLVRMDAANALGVYTGTRSRAVSADGTVSIGDPKNLERRGGVYIDGDEVAFCADYLATNPEDIGSDDGTRVRFGLPDPDLNGGFASGMNGLNLGTRTEESVVIVGDTIYLKNGLSLKDGFGNEITMREGGISMRRGESMFSLNSENGVLTGMQFSGQGASLYVGNLGSFNGISLESDSGSINVGASGGGISIDSDTGSIRAGYVGGGIGIKGNGAEIDMGFSGKLSDSALGELLWNGEKIS